MLGESPECGETGAREAGIRWTHCAVLAAVCALVIAIFAGSARSGTIELLGLKAENTYYNRLVRGFRAGQLNLKEEAPAGLAKLANPYDPAANAPYLWLGDQPAHDLSYYQGKLYLYHGITPALLLFWPVVALTGRFLFHRDAVVIFLSVGFLASTGLLWAVWRRFFAEVGVGVVAAGTLALGLATGLPVMLSRCDVYEVPISCGYALTMLALAAIWGALHDSRRRNLWLAAASLAYGLAAGARPSLLFGAVILLAPAAQAWRATATPGRRRRLWPLLAAAIVPIMLVGLGLMLYNALRFDNPFEFGWRYQLTPHRQDAGQFFSPRYLWCNFRIYFLDPASWSSRFPFAYDSATPALPAGHFTMIEHAFGVLTNTPLVWLALAAPLAWRNRPAAAGLTLRWFLAVVALFFGICALTLSLFFAALARYEVEFLPALTLLAVIGILSLERAWASRPDWRRAVRLGWGLLLTFSVAFNLLMTFEVRAGTSSSLGFLHLQWGRVNEAIAYFQRAVEILPGSAADHDLLGTTLIRAARTDEALAHFQRAVEIQPDNGLARNNLGLALLQKGRLDEAIACFQKVLAIQPPEAAPRAMACNNLGWIFLQRGQVDEAVAYFQQAVESKPDDARSHSNLGWSLLQKGQVDEAIAHLQKALELQPDFAEAHNSLGIALIQKGQAEAATAHFQRTLELQPDYAQAHSNLGWILLQSGRLDEAIAHLQAALKIQPDNATVRSNLASALLKRERAQ